MDTKGMTMGQIRVLQAMAASRGPLTRVRVQEKLGCSSTYVAKSVGFSDPAKRAAFEQTKDGGGTPDNPQPSLLTLGYLREEELVIPEDGINELTLFLTPKGRKALEDLGQLDLPSLR